LRTLLSSVAVREDRIMFASAFVRLLLAAALVGGLAAAEPAPRPDNVGRKIDPLPLTDLAGKPLALGERAATVVVFLSCECPVASSYVGTVADLAREFGPKKVRVVAVFPPDADVAEVKRQAESARLECPLCLDGKHAAAAALAARTTPEAFLLDQGGVLRYRGRIDDAWVNRGTRKARTARQDLKLALEELLAGQPVSEPITAAIGCPIMLERERPVTTTVTYYRDVLPILQNRCQTCHRPGEIGPFSLLTYKQAVKWAGDIKEFTSTRQMPPWKPTAGPEFVDERKLTEKEIATLAAWADGGTPEGDPKDAPPAVQYPDGWQLGKPDLILEPKEDFVLGPTGPDVFRSFVFPTDFPEDRFVIAYEVRPSNPKIVHHTLHVLDTQGRARRLEKREQERVKKPDEVDRGPGYSSRMGPGFFPPSGDVGGWAPGLRPHFLPEGVGFYLPRGSDIVMQVHYHRNGRLEKDRTRLGLYFAKKPGTKPIQPLVIPGQLLFIPAGVENYRVTGSVWAASDCTLHTITPHMHLLGKRIKVTMTPPGGETTTLIAVDPWDYNWQEMYTFKQPIRVKAGTKFTVEAYYDNSAKNPNNPSSPPRTAWVGEETTNEMCFGFIGAVNDEPGPLGIRLTPNGFAIRRPGLLPKGER
jgi:hypothetical protein